MWGVIEVIHISDWICGCGCGRDVPIFEMEILENSAQLDSDLIMQQSSVSVWPPAFTSSDGMGIN